MTPQPLTFSSPPDGSEELARAEVYGLLAQLFYGPPAEALYEQLQVAVTEAPARGAFLEGSFGELVAAARRLPLEVVRDEYATLFQGIGKPAFQQKVAAALKTYILRPGTLTATVKPPDPLPVSGIALFAAIFPDTLPDILGLDVTAVAGPEPVPLKYVPPADPGSSNGGDDLRHVPFKKY